MLSVVCLLKRLVEWTDSASTLIGVLATDNSPLLDRVKEQSATQYALPNATFTSDWDVVEAIVQTVAEIKLEATFKHVKGHQDKEHSYASLPFLAQLNVDADKYAGKYCKRCGSH